MEKRENADVRSLAAPIIVAVMLLVNIVDAFFLRITKKQDLYPEEAKLLQEITKLRKEANSLSGPSTFAQSAVLKRTAAAKEKELSKIKDNKSKNSSISTTLHHVLNASVLCFYLGLVWYFWGSPVATIPSRFFQPFGNALQSRFGKNESGFVEIGIVPWLFLTYRFNRSISSKLFSK